MHSPPSTLFPLLLNQNLHKHNMSGDKRSHTDMIGTHRVQVLRIEVADDDARKLIAKNRDWQIRHNFDHKLAPFFTGINTSTHEPVILTCSMDIAVQLFNKGLRRMGIVEVNTFTSNAANNKLVNNNSHGQYRIICGGDISIGSTEGGLVKLVHPLLLYASNYFSLPIDDHSIRL